MHKPVHSLIFVFLLFFNLGLICFFFPEKGIDLSDKLTLKLPSISSIFQNQIIKKDISKIIEAANYADTTTVVLDSPLKSDSVLTRELKDTTSKLIIGLQYTNKNALLNFFESLSYLKTNPKSIRVLHYGDSQIEGDRITDYLRMKLQGQFGGYGPGLISLMPISPSTTNKIIWNGTWDRYNVFAGKDKRVSHNNYGVLAGFSRFCDYNKKIDKDSALLSKIKIVSSKTAGPNSKYKKVKLFYGGAQTKTWCEFYDGPALISADSLESGGCFKLKEYSVALGSLTHEFKFKGKDSPDFYAVSLEGDNGVMVDNIALRGSSGTFFHQINFTQLKQFYDYLNVKLVILQFGGNVLPNIKDATMVVNYGNYIRAQISIIKNLAPKASIIFIGPADMSVKEGTEYVTHPQLEPIRNAVKKVVLESGCAFFDMYDCMGGRNSMVSWVDEKLAATDYIHFSPQGARKIATLYYSALIKEYNSYLKNKK